MRLPLAVNLESRDGDTDKDAIMFNALAEPKGPGDVRARSRSGSQSMGTVATGRVQMLAPFLDNIFSIINVAGVTTYFRGTVSGGTYTTGVSSGIAVPANIQASWVINPSIAAGRLVFSFPGTSALYFFDQTFAATTVGGGTSHWILQGYIPVPGLVYLDGYYFIMDTNARIWESDLDAPATWQSTHFVTANQKGGNAVGLGRSGNYVVAFKEFSSEFFWNAGNTPSVLGAVQNGFTQIGCLNGYSIKNVDDDLFWLSQTEALGLGVHMMRGLDQVKISTPDIDRVLNTLDITYVYANGVNYQGHRLYVLTCLDSSFDGITLVYDIGSKVWSVFTELTPNASDNISSLTRVDSIVTAVTATPHGASDGDPVLVAGATQTDYNGLQQVNVVDSTTFTYEIDTTPATPATGSPTATSYTDGYYDYVFFASISGYLVSLKTDGGDMYWVDEQFYQDAGNPINYLTRAQRLDGGTLDYKRMARITLVGDNYDTTIMVRWSDDDATTWTNYRQTNLLDDEPMIRRCGAFRRRQIEVRHVKNAPVNLMALELETT